MSGYEGEGFQELQKLCNWRRHEVDGCSVGSHSFSRGVDFPHYKPWSLFSDSENAQNGSQALGATILTHMFQLQASTQNPQDVIQLFSLS